MKYVETYTFEESGYQKLFHHQDWRVAMLNYIEELEIENLCYVESHTDTDEVFVLLNGSCTIYVAELKDGMINGFHTIKLEPHKIYKIPAGIYHTHTLSKDAKVLVIEQEDTSYDNSPRIYFTKEEKEMLIKQHEELT